MNEKPNWKKIINADLADFLFRMFFCSIFFILGLEHLFHDEVILKVMPEWFPMKRSLSVISGLTLLSGGALIFLGYKSRWGAIILAIFLVLVTGFVHVPAVAGVGTPPGLPQEWFWVWDLFQRSNLAKNLCLLGVCSHLMYHKVGKYSLEHYLKTHKN